MVKHTGILVSLIIRYKKHVLSFHLKGGTTLEKYRLEQHPLGKGATSLVFFGLNGKNERVVIKKVTMGSEAEQENEILKSLPVHKHIITGLDFFVEEQTGYIVLEYHEGSRLGYFKKGSIREQKLAVQITINILEGLKVIHQHNILHCDITPHNVLICNEQPQTVKIIDFGSAVQLNESGVYIGSHKGATRYYRPPELCKKNNCFTANLDTSSDLYSVACVCLYLLTGEAPVNKHQACAKVAHRGLQEVLMKATNKRKSKRYQSAQELIDALLPFI
ncbi:serine/threonine-protein kinase [Neobacillus drentensis]|uniref:serine/threonine-protein kinase n=1 Tax=Neobacillus drentensis TaxID=220684 RepID=UPI002FFF388D